MINIINILKGAFQEKSLEESPSEEEPLLDNNLDTNKPKKHSENIESIVSFTVSKDGNVDLHIGWNYIDDDTSEDLGKVLYLIHSGAFKANCINILLELAKNNPENAVFVRDVLNSWNNNSENEELIKPSEVFRFGISE